MKAHNMMPDLNHDERARQQFVSGLRRYLSAELMPGNQRVYEHNVQPAFIEKHGRAPETVKEVRREMTQNSYYQFWSAMQRRSQELMWESVIEPTERQLDALIERFRSIAKENPAGGSLALDPSLQIPKYHTAVDVHIQPGAYHTEFTDDDVAAGALYESGLPIYIGAGFGSQNDMLGTLLINFFKTLPSGLPVARVLDMGCAVGNSTLPWKVAYPEADMFAIDVAAPCLRFGHARAESLGIPVHFSQQNAEHTSFEDESFDLIVSHIMLHETSRPALTNIFKECHRLLKPGGRMLHLEVPRGTGAFQQFMLQWECYNNNETFAAFLTDANLPEMAANAGFETDAVSMHAADSGFGKGQKLYSDDDFLWPVLLGEKR